MANLTVIEQKLLQHLDVLRRAVLDGPAVTPAWRIMGGSSEWLITTETQPAQPEEVARLFGLIARAPASSRRLSSRITGTPRSTPVHRGRH
jgi:hypothetical protein